MFSFLKALQSISNFFTIHYYFLLHDMDSLCCGKATAVATVHRTVAKSRLSSPFWLSRSYSFQSFGLLSFFNQLKVVGQNGLEPSTSRLSVVCSSQLSYWPILVEISGIEPLTSCLQGRRSPSWAKPPNLFPSSSKVHFFLYPLNWITLILLNTLYWP